MYILDTDHASELAFRSDAGLCLLARLGKVETTVAISAITVEEQLRGWLAEIRRRNRLEDQTVAYSRLIKQVEIHASWRILPWDEGAVGVFKELRRRQIRIGTQDLKIAAIAIVNDATLLTRNTRDFSRVPGLKFDNWMD